MRIKPSTGYGAPKLKEYIGKDILTVFLPEGRLEVPTEPPIDFVANCASTPFDQPRLLIEAMQSLIQTQPELTILPGDDTPLVRDRYLSRNELIERLSNYVDLCVMYAESTVRHESAQLHGDRDEILRKETHGGNSDAETIKQHGQTVSPHAERH